MCRYSSKLSPKTKQQLSELPPKDNPLVTVLIRISGSLESQGQSQLEAIGGEIRTVAGDILTARIHLRELLQLAKLDFVSFIEISSPLYPESKTQ